jgi:hypothetical protein
VIAYKFLSAGAIGLYSGFRWPVPKNGEPGPWVHVDGRLVAGANGVHALTARELLDWIDDELWLVELAGEIDENEGILVARRGRLVRLVDSWTSATAREFAQDCVVRVGDCAIEALRRAGRSGDADAIRALDDLRALQSDAAALAKEAAGFAASALAYAADAVELARGGRPDHYGAHPGASARPSPGAVAANLGFVAAHVAASSLADATSDPGQYPVGFDRERERQRTWLTERAVLRRAPLGP